MCASTPNVPISRRVLVCSSNNSNSLVTPQIEILGIMEKPKALINSGASANFINSSFVNKHKLPRIELAKARQVQAIDGKNLDLRIRHRVQLTFWLQGRKCSERFYVMPLGNPTIILGMPWLKHQQPHIQWSSGKITLPEPTPRGFHGIQEEPEELQANLGMEEEADPLEEARKLVPQEYHEFLPIFGEEFFTMLPPH